MMLRSALIALCRQIEVDLRALKVVFGGHKKTYFNRFAHRMNHTDDLVSVIDFHIYFYALVCVCVPASYNFI